jgi:hypothetical protein
LVYLLDYSIPINCTRARRATKPRAALYNFFTLC